MAVQDEDIIVVGECNCGCGCNDVELHTDHQPEVLLFDEYGELYENDIIETRSLVGQIWSYIQEKATAILAAIGLVQGDVTTIKNEQRQGITDIEGTVTASETRIRGEVTGESASIKRMIADILINQELTECTEAEVDAMFPDIEIE